MNWAAFLGPSYSPDLAIDTQLLENFVTQKVEGNQGKNPFCLKRTPGLVTFCDASADGVTGRVSLFGLDGHLFAVAGNRVMEVFFNGTYNLFAGTVAEDNRPAAMAGNPDQLGIVVGGSGYVVENNALTQIASAGFPANARGLTAVASRFLTTRTNTQISQPSELLDGTDWDASKAFAAEAMIDVIAAIGSANNEYWAFGSQTIQVFDPTADEDQLFVPRQDVVLNYGIMAPDSLVNIGGSWYFIEGSSRGSGMVMRLAGYEMSRVSNHYIEEVIRQMTDPTDAVGWTYEENGHMYYVLFFRDADMTLVYDVATDQWHNRSWRNPDTNEREAHRGYSAACVFNKILVGDRDNGLIYEMSMNYLDDDGDLIHRIRRTPCIDSELDMITHSSFELDGNKGIGLDGIDPDTDPYNPNLDPAGMLRWSDNGGETWSSEYWRGFGRKGNFKRRVVWRRLGGARERVYEFSVSAAVDWLIVGCYINKRK